MVSPATKKADLGGIDTPPSANYLVVHNPAKCSVFWRSTQGHGEISFPFGNHPPPHPLFSLRSQTATSQLAGFRNNCNCKCRMSTAFSLRVMGREKKNWVCCFLRLPATMACFVLPRLFRSLVSHIDLQYFTSSNPSNHRRPKSETLVT